MNVGSISRSYVRKDNRIVAFTVEEDDVVDVQLQASGYEPLLIYNEGSDLQYAYNRGGPWFPLPDGYTYTFEFKHPFGGEFYLNNATAVTSTITFAIGGNLYDR